MGQSAETLAVCSACYLLYLLAIMVVSEPVTPMGSVLDAVRRFCTSTRGSCWWQRLTPADSQATSTALPRRSKAAGRMHVWSTLVTRIIATRPT
jgi:hypothetical protein